MKTYFIAIGLLLAILFVSMSLKSSKTNYQSGGQWIVYGTMGCGWTRKQLDHLKENGVSYKFVECDKGDCPGTVKAYPTCQLPSGEMKVGFTSIN